jgi:transposase-like protein
MARKVLSAAEIVILRESPFVSDVSSGRIQFTPEFKRNAYHQLLMGKTMREVFTECGIDPEILGNARIYGFAQKLRQNADRDGGFNDLRDINSRKPAKGTKEQTMAARIEQLEHELAYTRQEVEFLKKIRLADMEAQKQWEESKRRQK